MPQTGSIERTIFQIDNPDAFNVAALQIFQYQYKSNAVFQDFVNRLQINTELIDHYSQIPFLPIEFFKRHRMVSGQFKEEVIFSSSGTIGIQRSQHYLKSTGLYKNSFEKAFQLFFNDLNNTVILALLPSYLEQENSSLVFMVNRLMDKSAQPENGFYLNDYEKLAEQLVLLKKQNKRIILFGVTYALLDLAEQFPLHFPELVIIETGGMKGRRKEMVREELHYKLKKAFQVGKIYSEYGMTELLSQAYSLGDGIFQTPGWMKVLIRDPNDPLTLLKEGKTGGINVIDLANIHSCSFIATQDLGRKFDDGSFEVLGRFDNSDIRGCNLLVD